jgi:hypothetical protein
MSAKEDLLIAEKMEILKEDTLRVCEEVPE